MNRKPESLTEATDLAQRILKKRVADHPEVLRLLTEQDVISDYEQRPNVELLTLARDDPLAWEALILRIVRSVDQSGEVPRDLRRFHRRVLWGDLPRPSAGQGAPSAAPLHRVVILSVSALNRLGVRQKDPDPERLSAIRAVAAAMDHLGIAPRTYAAVEDLWRRSGQLRRQLNSERITIPELEIDLPPTS